MSTSKMYTTGDAARFLQVSQSTVINYIDRGILAPDSVLPSLSGRSGRRLFSEETLKEFKKKISNKEIEE